MHCVPCGPLAFVDESDCESDDDDDGGSDGSPRCAGDAKEDEYSKVKPRYRGPNGFYGVKGI